MIVVGYQAFARWAMGNLCKTEEIVMPLECCEGCCEVVMNRRYRERKGAGSRVQAGDQGTEVGQHQCF